MRSSELAHRVPFSALSENRLLWPQLRKVPLSISRQMGREAHSPLLYDGSHRPPRASQTPDGANRDSSFWMNGPRPMHSIVLGLSAVLFPNRGSTQPIRPNSTAGTVKTTFCPSSSASTPQWRCCSTPSSRTSLPLPPRTAGTSPSPPAQLHALANAPAIERTRVLA